MSQLDVLALNFDEAFSAPDGMKRLRELILTLAMQGKLVEQDESEGTADDVLREIEAEKKRLVQAGTIKAPKPLPPVEADEVPYELPQRWRWVRLGELAEIVRGVTYSKADADSTAFSGSVELLRANNIGLDINLASSSC